MKFRDFEKYEVYSDGKIWSYSHKKFLKPSTLQSGYQRVCLTDNEGKAKCYLLHRVIWEAVTGEQIPEGYEINHLNEIKTDNTISNLELVTHKQNLNFGTRNSRASKSLTNNTKISKAVGAFKNGELVMVFPSINESQRQCFNQGHVCDCCNGKRKTHKGFEWKFI